MELATDMRDALIAAGLQPSTYLGTNGLYGRADLAGLNLAATLQDGQQVLVPERLPAGAGAPAGAAAGAEQPVRLSSATPDQLEGLDGIGPTLAARIVEWRDDHGGFSSVDALLEVPGIGPSRLESLREKVVP